MRDTDTIGLVAFVLAVAFTFVGALLSGQEAPAGLSRIREAAVLIAGDILSEIRHPQDELRP